MAGEWDPFGMDEAAEPAPAAPAASASGEAGGDIDVTVTARNEDVEESYNKLKEYLRHNKPWAQAQNNSTDLSWHTPTCTLDTWGHKDVTVKLGEGIAYVTFNRPNQSNTLNDTINAAINDALLDLHRRKDIRIVVFSGEGKMFCAGTDPKQARDDAMVEIGKGGLTNDGTEGNRIQLAPMSAEARQACEALAERATQAGALDGGGDLSHVLSAKQWHAWASLPQFTIALVNGSAMGSGIGVISVCDMAISVKSAFFNFSEAKSGLLPATYSPYIIGKLGSLITMRMLCTGANIGAEQAKTARLVNEVVGSLAEGHKMVREICEQLTLAGPQAVADAKELCVGVAGQPITEQLMFYAAQKLAMVVASPEAMAGKAATESRKPKPWEASPIKPLY